MPRAHLLERSLGGNAAVHQPGPARPAPAPFHFVEKLLQRRRLVRVAGIDFVPNRQPIGRQHQRDDHLRAVGTMVAAVAEAPLAARIPRRIALEVRARQVVEQHLALRLEQLAPALPQVREQRLAMRREQVQATVELVLLRQREVLAQQVAHGARVIPLAVHAPLAARVDQPVSGQRGEQVRPTRALAAGRQPLPPEFVQAQQAPQLERQPAGAELARPPEPHRRHPHAHRLVLERRRQLAVIGKQRQLS